MPYTFDYYVAELRCPTCDFVSKADDTTNMVTYIRDDPQLEYLGVGHPLDVPVGRMAEHGYLTVHEATRGEPVRILHAWECPQCGTAPHWAEIIVRDGVIESITAVPLNLVTLERVNYVDDNVKGVAAALTGRAFADVAYEEAVPTLRRVLPGGTEPT